MDFQVVEAETWNSRQSDANRVAAKETMHTTRRARQNSGARFYRPLDLPVKTDTGSEMVSLLRQPVSTEKLRHLTQPRVAEQRHH